ncbi:MAG: DNA ligase D [Gemmatimonadetes bacterium]|nr:DNA ligase D [Gemmatimonadota bacterium]
MTLESYRQKRHFGRTPEPSGRRKKRASGRAFVVHKHAATRLHYDFRLELEGVLKSWAVPKGPSLDPADRRLAMHVEDHPLEYGGFEGVIPPGEYGAGAVMVWDQGVWLPQGDPSEAYRKGRLKFELRGKKLHGGWTLVRMGGRPAERGKESWLLIKERDRHARPGEGELLLESRGKSALTRRTLEQIAGAADRLWTRGGEVGGSAPIPAGKRSKRSGPAEAPARQRLKATRTAARRAGSRSSAPQPPAARVPALAALPGVRESTLPKSLEPQLARLVSEVPPGDLWLHELKFDGYRILCRLQDGRARLMTRHGKDWTDRFAPIAEAAGALPLESALLDGEVVALQPDGTTSFQALQNALSRDRQEDLVYYAFDLPYLNGYDLRALPLEQRKSILSALLTGDAAEAGRIRYSDHVEGRGEEFHRQACALGLEGIVAKRRDAPYRSGRARDWLKVKCLQRQEFVVGGYTDPSGARTGFGALLLGVYRDGRLVHVGKVGTGFTDQSLRDLHARLRELERTTPPFSNPPRGAAARGVHWVEPKLVAEVAFTEWTEDDVLRHPSFQGLREDKRPQEVVRERPQRAAEAAGERASAAVVSGDGAARTASSRRAGPVQVAGVRLTNPDRVLYPAEAISKLELARYYETVAEWILPHVKDRPLTLVRCPEGHEKECFFQKHAPELIGPGLEKVEVAEEKGAATYLAITSLPGLIWLVQMGVLELHVSNARQDRPERPDQIVFDLDPGPGVEWRAVLEAARRMRDRLEELGLTSFVKTTGGKGLHVVVPLARRHDWDEVRTFARAVAEDIARTAPDRFTVQMAKAERDGKIFLDYLRNARGQTAVVAYSTRARAGAPVATPLAWDELEPGIRSDSFNIRNLPERLSGLEQDPWAGFAETVQWIGAAARRALGLKR